MKKSLKIALVIVMLLTTIISISGSVFAAYEGYDVEGNLKPNSGATGVDKIQDAGNNILGLLVWGAIAVAGIMIVIIGIKYMIGSAEQKAEYKKTMIPFAVGMLLVVGATSIVAWLFSIKI